MPSFPVGQLLDFNDTVEVNYNTGVARTRGRRRTRRNILVVGALIVVAVVSMLAYSALFADQPPSEENQPEQDEIVDPVITPAGTPEDAGAPEDQPPPEE